MRAFVASAVLLFLVPGALAQVVDRIVARIENDIITLGEVRELGAFQQLAGRPRSSDDDLLRQLIEQWIVANDAAASRFPLPAAADVDREMAALAATHQPPEAFRGRLEALRLTEKAVRRLVERQIYLERYLEYRFRPAVQIGRADVERYYREELTPQLHGRSEAVPTLEKVAHQIRELLTQREISRRAAEWLEQTRAQLRIEISQGDPAPKENP